MGSVPVLKPKEVSDILLRMKDKSKEKAFVNFPKELSFLEIEEGEKTKKAGECADFRKLFGIWKNRDMTVSGIRDQAWATRILPLEFLENAIKISL